MIAVAVTVALAFAGFAATYLNGLRLAQRQERLARVNRQLSDFYGPLFALTEANARTFAAFAERHGRPGGVSPFGDEAAPPTDEELADWRLWVTTVFLPVLRDMRELVVGRADLLREPEMPSLLLELCAHAAGYEITVARWALGDFSEHLSLVAFPSAELAAYARRGFGELKWEQARLLGGGAAVSS
jgi:hypothetical protein